MKGVSFRPSKLEIQIDDSEGPDHNATHATARVELRGPAVPALFRKGAEKWRPRILLRGKSDALHARLTNFQTTRDHEVAVARFSLDGNLKPGKYASEIPLSDLSSDSPTLPFTITVRDSFVWAALTVFVGALIGGFLYLASARTRRKRLLRMYVKDALRQYRARLKTLDERTIELWDLTPYLGDSRHWFQVRWSAFPERDGVRGIWSTIAWARSNDDLDGAADQTRTLVDRVSRWLTVADSVVQLYDASNLKPSTSPGLAPAAHQTDWADTATARETRRLLARLRTIEPADAPTAAQLVALAKRQSRWHATLARVWHMKNVVAAAVFDSKTTIKQKDIQTLADMNLLKIANEQGPVRRTEDEQLDDEQALADYQEDLATIYMEAKFPMNVEDLADFDPPGPSAAVELGAISPSQAVLRSRTGPLLPQPATRLQRMEDRFVELWANRYMGRILIRDLVWTLVTAAVVSAAYIPPFYSATWGSAGDYATAFAAGFLGKVVINWVSLPSFSSLIPWRKGSGTKEEAAQVKQETQQPGDAGKGDAVGAPGPAAPHAPSGLGARPAGAT